MWITNAQVKGQAYVIASELNFKQLNKDVFIN